MQRAESAANDAICEIQVRFQGTSLLLRIAGVSKTLRLGRSGTACSNVHFLHTVCFASIDYMQIRH